MNYNCCTIKIIYLGFVRRYEHSYPPMNGNLDRIRELCFTKLTRPLAWKVQLFWGRQGPHTVSTLSWTAVSKYMF